MTAGDFLLEGRDCECDDTFRCANHDDDAEAAYWYDQFRGIQQPTVADVEDAYEFGDPKGFELVGPVTGERVRHLSEVEHAGRVGDYCASQGWRLNALTGDMRLIVALVVPPLEGQLWRLEADRDLAVHGEPRERPTGFLARLRAARGEVPS